LKRRYALSLVGLLACKLGGPSADPDEYVAFPDATADSAVSINPASDDGSSGPADDASGDEADDTGDAGPLGDGGGGPVSADGSCGPAIAVCNPIHNSGCNPFQQCDVDPRLSSASAPVGTCLNYNGSDAATGACMVSIFNESCSAGSTCIDGGCEKLCTCATDCASGQCCLANAGPPGFSLCGVCP
jgi:hypothetical protein